MHAGNVYTLVSVKVGRLWRASVVTSLRLTAHRTGVMAAASTV